MLGEGVHYTCITCINIDSVMRIETKNYPQVYLEESKYKIKKQKKIDDDLRVRFSFSVIVFVCLLGDVLKPVNPKHRIQKNLAQVLRQCSVQVLVANFVL